jgi:tetratricopeptide (TPR) repeat protein
MAEAMAHLDAGRYAQAIAMLKPLAEQEPTNLGAQFNLALAYSLAGENTEAVAGFRKVLTIQPDLYEAEVNLGRLLLSAGQFEESSSLLAKAAAQKPSETKARILLARALAGLSKWREAAEAMQQGLDLDPANASLSLELAGFYEKSQQPEKAAAIYRQFPKDAGARERLGLILMNSDLPAAIENLEAALAISPSPGLMYLLATTYLRAKQPEKSTPLAARLVEAEPSNLDLRMFYGRLLRDQKKYEDAAQQFAAVVKAKPDSVEGWNELSGMLIVMKRYEQALAALERVKALSGETPAYFYFRATMLDAMQQQKAALESYEKFLAASEGKYPEEEFKARQRAKVLERAVHR